MASDWGLPPKPAGRGRPTEKPSSRSSPVLGALIAFVAGLIVLSILVSAIGARGRGENERVFVETPGRSQSSALATLPDTSRGELKQSQQPTTTEFYGIQGRGNSFVFVVDRSGSMAGDSLTTAKHELIDALARLRENDRFHIIFFDHEFIELDGGGLRAASAEHKDDARRWVETVEARGGTEPGPAFKRALQLGPDVVYFLTDGLIPEDTPAIVREHNAGQRSRIHTICLRESPVTFLGVQVAGGDDVLPRQIAQENGGECRAVQAGAVSTSQQPAR